MTLNDPVVPHRRSCTDDLAPAATPTSPSGLRLPVHSEHDRTLPLPPDHEHSRQLPIPGEHEPRSLPKPVRSEKKEHPSGRRLPQLSSLHKDRDSHDLDYGHHGGNFNPGRNLQELPADYQDMRPGHMSHHHDYHQLSDPDQDNPLGNYIYYKLLVLI